jgi:mannan endo-1,6-alpha-mannosidase
LVSKYNVTEPGHIIGVLGAPYYWWESGAFFDTLISYWHLTGDDQYNDLVSDGLQAQLGQNDDFMPANWTNTEGNDDQAIWALAVMSAAESKFPQYDDHFVVLAENVFNEQVLRWDNATCGGGLRWQIFPFLTGYDYKNSAANGAFFSLASRLARYTGNSTYSDWASQAFKWATSIGFVDSDWRVYDGAHVETACTDINKVQFSSTAGYFISGVAYMYNITNGDSIWKNALDGLLNSTLSTFFPDGIAYEVACESKMTCTTDMWAFKGLLGQALVDTVKVAPYTADTITPILSSTAEAAAKACNDTQCAFQWSTTSTSRARALGDAVDTPNTGVGEQISALSYVQGLLVKDAAAPETHEEYGSNATSTSGSGGSSTQSGTPTSTSSGTATGTGTGTGTASASPSSSGNAGTVLRVDNAGMGLFGGLLGVMAWLIL